MKTSRISKTLGLSALALSLSTLVAVVPVSAQETTGTINTTTEEAGDDDFDGGNWGLLGLLGLFGLLGLRNNNADTTERYRDPAVGSGTTTTRY